MFVKRTIYDLFGNSDIYKNNTNLVDEFIKS